ncbi:zf-HC2 domain-containing protein [Nocardia sp. IBHARD005]|uniref:zf-HC2 domain-containing protein n=1 Tax=Nocardia sp. IBHARD005 TaxID=3457765 RepID=UPI004059763E
MRCETAREAVSAQIDGEPVPVPAARLAEHLDGCPSCRSWQLLLLGVAPTVDRHLAGTAPRLPGSLGEAIDTDAGPPSRASAALTGPGAWTNLVHIALAAEVALLAVAIGFPFWAACLAALVGVTALFSIRRVTARRTTYQPDADIPPIVLPARAEPGRPRLRAVTDPGPGPTP